MEVYMVEVICNLIFRHRNWFVVGFQHVSYYGKATSSGTAGIAGHAPCFENGQTGQRRVFAHHNGGYALAHQETWCRSQSRIEAGCCVSRENKGGGCDRKTPSYGSWKCYTWLPFLVKWYSKVPADILKAQTHGCNSIWTNTSSPRNCTCAPTPPCDNEGAELCGNKGVPPRYGYIHTPLPRTEFCNHDTCAKDRNRDQDCIPDLLTAEGTTTGLYTTWWVVMGLTSILWIRAPYWANLEVKKSIDQQ